MRDYIYLVRRIGKSRQKEKGENIKLLSYFREKS